MRAICSENQLIFDETGILANNEIPNAFRFIFWDALLIGFKSKKVYCILGVKEIVMNAQKINATKNNSKTKTKPFFDSTTIFPKLTINSPNDQYEQQADAMAEKVMRMENSSLTEGNEEENNLQTKPLHVIQKMDREEEGIQRQCAPCDEEKVMQKQTKEGSNELIARPLMRKTKNEGYEASPELSNQLNHSKGGGSPLSGQILTSMNQAFGADFSNVRIHQGGAATKMSQGIQAKAFTHDSDIYFNQGQFNPNSRSGKHLLAHELTHVVQQGGDHSLTSNSIQRNSPGTTANQTICQGIQDILAAQERRMAEQRSQSLLVFSPPSHDAYKKLVPLCLAIEQKRINEIPDLVDEFIGANWTPLDVLNETLLYELGVRLREMGLNGQNDRLREHYEERQSIRGGRQRRTVRFFRRLVEYAISQSQGVANDQLGPALNFLIDSFIPIRDTFASINPDQLRFTRRDALVLRPGINIWDFHDGLLAEIRNLFRGIQVTIQTMMELAISELESGGESETLNNLNEILQNNLRPALQPTDDKKNIAGIRIDITQTTMRGTGRGTVKDAFLQGRQGRDRNLPVNTYDPRQTYMQELQTSLMGLYERRIKQIQALGRIYGQIEVMKRERPFTDGFSQLQDARHNASTLRNMEGNLRLHNNEDWRRFVLQKYRDAVAPPPGTMRLRQSPAEAFHAIVDLLFTYLSAFTVHARFTNVYDIGDNYLNRNFPRALTGQLVHDCGVYALRVAYILSLVRIELGLRFRFVRLPAHLGLVIDGDNIPTIIVHNNHFNEIKRENWEELQENWKDQDSADSKTDDQFVGEMAAAIFIIGPLDMPFKISDVPVVNDQTRRAQNALWRYYQREATKPIFGPGSQNRNDPNYLFHQRYLAIIKRQVEMHNELLVPFWNEVAPTTWQNFMKKVEERKQGQEIERGILSELLTAHRTEYQEAVGPLKARWNSIKAEESLISDRLRNNPNLHRSGISISDGLRAASLWVYQWENYGNRLDNQISQFSQQPEGKTQVTDIQDLLKPPFIPIEENWISFID